ncbi:MAG TPA: phosphatase PAP2 family protein, partial [Thermoanaerobaculia bacterium]|nr:phosphatase PAP2 family protein [Thermoanaerobaculia bacterium]
IDAKRAAASWAFVALLVLSVFWPSPVTAINDVCCHAPLSIDDLSFLGREAPSWDVAFWCIAGLFTLVLLQDVREFRPVAGEWRAIRFRTSARVFSAVIFSAVIVAAIWLYVDAGATALSERLSTDDVEDWIRLANRFGGGMNPVMIIAFFFLAGLAYAKPRWIGYAIRMAIAGAIGGIIVQIVKFAVARTRPELWLGPFQHARSSASSFPSGHTVGAFALAGVLILGAESRALRIAAALLALAVAVSRVLAFRHWASDVTASAAIGMIVAATLSLPVPRSSR